jgi:hypothetical protein
MQPARPPPTESLTDPNQSNRHASIRGLLDLLEGSRLGARNPGLMAAVEGVLRYGGADK